MTKIELLENIINGFSQVPYPGENDLTYHPLGFDEDFYDSIKGKTWQELDTAMLQYHHGCIGILTPKGFQYYLPAFLVADLKDENGTIISEMLIIELSTCATNSGSPVKGLSGHQWFSERMTLFSKEQVEALLNFLNYYKTPDQINETIEDIDNIINYLKLQKWKSI
jgi:hypothetical protein